MKRIFTIICTILLLLWQSDSFAQLYFQGGEGTAADNWSYVTTGASANAITYAALAANRKSGNTSLVVGGNTGGGDCITGCCSGNGASVQRKFTFSNVDVSLCSTNSSLSFYYGNYTPACAGDGWDAGENLVFTPYHNGVAQAPQLLVSGAGDLHWSLPATQFTYAVPSGLSTFSFTLAINTNRADEFLFLDDVSFSCTVSLPLQLVSFNAAYVDRSVSLSWETESEMNTSYFELERSNDAIRFYSIGKISAAGSSDHSVQYFFNDENPLSSTTYYRLKMVDLNGNFSYSNIRSINLEAKTNEIKLFPQSANDELHVVVNIQPGSSYTISIYNALGKLMHQVEDVAEDNDQLILSTTDLKPGIYFLILQTETEVYSAQFVKQ